MIVHRAEDLNLLSSLIPGGTVTAGGSRQQALSLTYTIFKIHFCSNNYKTNFVPLSPAQWDTLCLLCGRRGMVRVC